MRDDEQFDVGHDDIEYRLTQVKSLGRMLRESTLESPMRMPPKEQSFADEIPRLPRWPSGLGAEFDAQFGGFQAVTVLGGPAGVGKSQWAIACAMDNAYEKDCCVLYFDAENYEGEQRERVLRWHGGPGGFLAHYQTFSRFFVWSAIDHTTDWTSMMHFAASRLTRHHQRVLIILDSLQSIADEIEPGRMLQVTAALYSTMNRMVRASGGRISFLVLSEINKEGGMKGGAGAYRGTMIMRIERPEDDQGEGIYRVSMLKNRTGRTVGDLGLFELQHHRCRFVKVNLT